MKKLEISISKMPIFIKLTVVLFLAGLISCSGISVAPIGTESHATVDASKLATIVTVYFATNRKEVSGAPNSSRFSGERGSLVYGMTDVSIPAIHKIGELESPSMWKLEFHEDPAKHVILSNIQKLSKQDFFSSMSHAVKQSKKKNTFVFIHGYNVSFEDASRRTAQIAFDMDFDGAAVFFSWPSAANAAKYTFDEENISWAEKDIRKFLGDVANKSGADNIYLIAHSMGNRALTRAYIETVRNNPELRQRFTEIILAAPDIDADTFKRELAPALVEAGNPITLYASSEDLALKASKEFHGGYKRAGDSGGNIIIHPGIESIDATNVDTSFLGHSIFAQERPVITDMSYLIHDGLRADDRKGLRSKSGPNGKYWLFIR